LAVKSLSRNLAARNLADR